MSHTLQAAELMTAREWQASRGSRIFKSWSAFEWFLRQNRERLVKEGALIPRYGSRGSLVTPRIDTIIPEIFLDQARGAA